MSTWRHFDPRTSPKAGFTLVECLVVALILVILVAVLLPTATQTLGPHPSHDLMNQGTQIYRSVFSTMLDDPDAGGNEFPSSTNGFTTSTQYFVHLVTNGTLKADFSMFTGPYLPRHRTTDPAQFKPDGNAWSVVLDVSDEIASFPFLISRNLLPAATNVPPQTAALTPAMLGEKGWGKKLVFNTKSAVIVTKAGTGFIIGKKDFTGTPGSMSRLNPADVSKPILRP